MLKVLMHGRLAKDVEMRTTTTGKNVASFTVACDVGYGENKKTEFVPCIAWNKTAELMGNYFSKGREILITDGRLQTRSYEKNGEKRYVTEVVVNEVEFCGSKADHTKKDVGGFGGEPVNDSDIPF